MATLVFYAFYSCSRAGGSNDGFNTPEFYGWAESEASLTLISPVAPELYGMFSLSWCVNRSTDSDSSPIVVEATLCGATLASSTAGCFDTNVSALRACATADAAADLCVLARDANGKVVDANTIGLALNAGDPRPRRHLAGCFELVRHVNAQQSPAVDDEDGAWRLHAEGVVCARRGDRGETRTSDPAECQATMQSDL